MTLADRLRETADMLHRGVGTEADEANVRAAIARIEAADPWARFGDAVFERFWNDGYLGDVDGGDLCEMAREYGLLGRTAEHDAGATHADECEWQPGDDNDECDCWTPLRAPYRAVRSPVEGGRDGARR